MQICKEELTVINQSSLDTIASDEVPTEDIRQSQSAVDKILRENQTGREVSDTMQWGQDFVRSKQNRLAV